MDERRAALRMQVFTYRRLLARLLSVTYLHLDL